MKILVPLIALGAVGVVVGLMYLGVRFARRLFWKLMREMINH